MAGSNGAGAGAPADGGADGTDDPEREAADSADGECGRPCPRCASAMIHRHCKYVCPQHGVVFDCSDTFY